MAIGIPKKNNTLLDSEVHLDYRGKATEKEIFNGSIVPFDKLHSNPSHKRLYFGDNLDVLRVLVTDPNICGKVHLI